MKRSKLWIALLAALLLAGCVKTNYASLSPKEFTDKVERYGAVTEAVSAGDVFSSDHPEALVGRIFFANSDKSWSGAFWAFDADAAAQVCFSRLSEAYQPEMLYSPGEAYERFEVTLSEGAQPVVRVIRVQETVLLLSCADNDAARDAAGKLLVFLNYN